MSGCELWNRYYAGTIHGYVKYIYYNDDEWFESDVSLWNSNCTGDRVPRQYCT